MREEGTEGREKEGGVSKEEEEEKWEKGFLGR